MVLNLFAIGVDEALTGSSMTRETRNVDFPFAATRSVKPSAARGYPPRTMSLVRELIGLGAVAYLVKSATIEELHAAVHTVAKRCHCFGRLPVGKMVARDYRGATGTSESRRSHGPA